MFDVFRMYEIEEWSLMNQKIDILQELTNNDNNRFFIFTNCYLETIINIYNIKMLVIHYFTVFLYNI